MKKILFIIMALFIISCQKENIEEPLFLQKRFEESQIWQQENTNADFKVQIKENTLDPVTFYSGNIPAGCYFEIQFVSKINGEVITHTTDILILEYSGEEEVVTFTFTEDNENLFIEINWQNSTDNVILEFSKTDIDPDFLTICKKEIK